MSAAFVYGDFWHKGSWKRISGADLEKHRTNANNTDVFISVQKYDSNVQSENGAENYLAPLYFDIDNVNLEVSKVATKQVVKFLMTDLGILEDYIDIYFSGNKGFHIIVNETVLDIKPAIDTHKVFKHLAKYIIEYVGSEELKTSLDTSVYSVRRVLRLNNSINSKSGLYKIQLHRHELELPIKEIQELATKPRHIEKNVSYSVLKFAATFYQDKIREHAELLSNQQAKNEQVTHHFKKGVFPECVKDIFENGWKKDGDRNQATVQLACFFKAAGYDMQETQTMLADFTARFTTAGGHANVEKRKANARAVVESVYNDSGYKFGCALIRSLHGLKIGDDYERVACAGKHCTFIKPDYTDEKPIELNLVDTDKAVYSGKLVKTRIMLAGKRQTAYIIPSKLEFTCRGKDSCKSTGCPLYTIPTGSLYKELGYKDPELVQMCGESSTKVDMILQNLLGIKKCSKFDIKKLESINVNELVVIPMAEQDNEHNKYVVRQIYTIGDMELEDNKYYEVLGYVFPHPKTQEGIIIARDAVPLQDKVESFVLSDDIKVAFKAFKCDNTKEGIMEKVEEIMKDITYNITGIVERDDMLLSVLLTMHSILRLKVPWDNEPIRGWLESIVIGDTGTGKSALMNKLFNYLGLGSKVNAESTTRTGLTYKMEQSITGSWYIIWGAWPMADKEMIWIDEASAISKDEYGQMTLARSDGILEVKRAVTAETYCRVRAILTGNVPLGKRLSDYGQGCTSLKDIFNNEDIRRFDFGVFMRSSDVNPLAHEGNSTVENKMTKDLLKSSILFAWSRHANNVKFTPEALKEVSAATSYLVEKYGNALLVPLVSPADQRNKVARLSAAIACLVHSVDSSGENIVVEVGHVQFIKAYLEVLYDNPSCGLNNVAALSIEEKVLNNDGFDEVTAELKTDAPILNNAAIFKRFIKIMAPQQFLKKSDIEDMLGLSKDETKSILAALAGLNMIASTSFGYKKTSNFNNYINKCIELKII